MKTFGENTTIGEKYGPAMKITDQKEADEYFEACVQHCMQTWGLTRDDAISTERNNIGYYAGYYSDETRERIERLFRTVHPIFGCVSGRSQSKKYIGANGREPMLGGK